MEGERERERERGGKRGREAYMYKDRDGET
jgi:hypothetical protein